MIWIVIPTYNSGDTLISLVRDIRKVMDGLGEDYNITLVDDGSDERNRRIMRDLGVEVLWGDHVGPIRNVLRGFEHIEPRVDEDDIVIKMDSDYEHDPVYLPVIVEGAKEGCGVVVYLRNDPRYGLLYNLLNRWAGSREHEYMYGEAIPQFSPGYYGLRGSYFKRGLERVKPHMKGLLHLDPLLIYLSGCKPRFVEGKPRKITPKPLSKILFYWKKHHDFMQRLKTLKEG